MASSSLLKVKLPKEYNWHPINRNTAKINLEAWQFNYAKMHVAGRACILHICQKYKLESPDTRHTLRKTKLETCSLTGKSLIASVPPYKNCATSPSVSGGD